MSECSLSRRGQGHVSNFYIVDLENFATASRRCTGDIHNWTVVGLFMTHLRQRKRLGRVMVECTLSITHCVRLNLQLHTVDLVRTCRMSSFCTVAWQLASFQLTRRIARSLGDSWASCSFCPTALKLRWSNFLCVAKNIVAFNLRTRTFVWAKRTTCWTNLRVLLVLFLVHLCRWNKKNRKKYALCSFISNLVTF